MADRIRGVLEGTDSASMIGGDEFVVLVHSARGATDLDRRRLHLKQLLSEPYVLPSATGPVRISVSAGAGCSGDDPAAVLRIADGRMYRDKPRPR